MLDAVTLMTERALRAVSSSYVRQEVFRINGTIQGDFEDGLLVRRQVTVQLTGEVWIDVLLPQIPARKEPETGGHLEKPGLPAIPLPRRGLEWTERAQVIRNRHADQPNPITPIKENTDRPIGLSRRDGRC